MNTITTFPVRAATSIAIRQPRPVHCEIAAKKSLPKRFQHFIETTDWEERYLCNHWIDKMCLCGIVISMIYFAPLLMSIIQE
jgi:hypothetical protein